MGLRNDHEPETFLLKHKANTVVFPCQYIKIVPLMAWGANFNFSVWFVEVKGIDDPEIVQETYFQYINFRETESVRLCLKHFRQRKLIEAFRELQQRTQILLEDPILTELYHELVVKGNFKRAEEIMLEAANRNMFEEYSKNFEYKPIWRRQGGPGARSCHKICYSAQHSAIFLLGRYVDPNNRIGADLQSDFWRYDIDPNAAPFGRWTKLSNNTAAMNGPELIYDHQMCLDPVSQTLYVFGGKVVHPDNTIHHYSGLYSYHIPTGIWRLLRIDGSPPPKQDKGVVLRSRIGHSMLYDEVLRCLVIFAGQMNKDYLSDFYVYDIAADRVIEVCKDYNKQGGPEAGFTQRSTISSKNREIYVLSGLVKDRALGAEQVKNSLWVFKLPGKNQMDAIRDVQLALASSKITGSIGTLDQIMNLGATQRKEAGIDSFDILSMQDSRAENHANIRYSESPQGGRISSSRRRTNQEVGSSENGGPQSSVESALSAHAQSRRATNTRSAQLTPPPPPQSTPGASPAAARVSRTRNINKSVTGGRSTATSPTRPTSILRRGSSSTASQPPSLTPQITNVVSPNNSSSIRPSMLAAREMPALSLGPGQTAPSTSGQFSHMSRPMATNYPNVMESFPGPSCNLGAIPNETPMEPLTLAYVLSDQGSWKKIYQNSNPELGELEPAPRYAHQLVYDDVNEVQYLFGGNPGEQGNMSKRLDDFWELRLYKPKPEHIIRKARYLIRTQQFKEICQRPETSLLTSTTVMTDELAADEAKRKRMIKMHREKVARGQVEGGSVLMSSPIQRGTEAHLDQSRRAINFLRAELSGIVDHTNKVENEEFHVLIRGLLVGGFSRTSSMSTSPTVSHAISLSSLGTISGKGGAPPLAGSQFAGLAQPAYSQSPAYQLPQTTVKLASTPVTSPNMSACPRLMLSPNPGNDSSPTLPPLALSGATFLTSPKNNRSETTSRFLSLSHFGVPTEQRQMNSSSFSNTTNGNALDEDSVMTPAIAGLARDKHETDGVVPRDPNNSTPEEDDEVDEAEGVDMSGRRQGVRTAESGKSQVNATTVDPNGGGSGGGGIDKDVNDGNDDNDDNDDDDDIDDNNHDGTIESEEEDEDELSEEEWVEGLNEEHDRVMRACVRNRIILYEKLLEFFAEEVKQPKGDLIDLVKVG
ncbi:Muskelin 1, intracellular mediator containing kelch motif [Actinomortierella wolfii]|nr:Muskelin 1, intracellular mediator containing kelch motif [Actinomortierella wolfii]